MKFPIPSLAKQFTPILTPVPALAGPGNFMFFASSGSGGDTENTPTPEPDYDAQPTRREPGAPRGAAASSSGGRERTIDLQPGDRYWTEYLRIALPIIGLLLMIGLFWFWASKLANGNTPNQPVGTNTPGSTILITPESTPQATEEIISPPTSEPKPTEPPAVTPTPTEEAPTEAPGAFAPLDMVTVTDSVNLREEPSSKSNSLGILAAGTVLEVQDGPFEGSDGYVWWEVVVSDTNEVGYVAEDFIQLVN